MLGGLESKPLLQTRPAEGMEAVKERQRLVQELGAYLCFPQSIVVRVEIRELLVASGSKRTEHVSSFWRSRGFEASIHDISWGLEPVYPGT